MSRSGPVALGLGPVASVALSHDERQQRQPQPLPGPGHDRGVRHRRAPGGLLRAPLRRAEPGVRAHPQRRLPGARHPYRRDPAPEGGRDRGPGASRHRGRHRARAGQRQPAAGSARGLGAHRGVRAGVPCVPGRGGGPDRHRRDDLDVDRAEHLQGDALRRRRPARCLDDRPRPPRSRAPPSRTHRPTPLPSPVHDAPSSPGMPPGRGTLPARACRSARGLPSVTVRRGARGSARRARRRRNRRPGSARPNGCGCRFPECCRAR